LAVSKKASKERIYQLRMLEKKYQQRFTLTRMAKEAQGRGDLKTMVTKYTEYLKLLADIHEVGPYELVPSHIDKKHVSELLLISQVYYELAKVYDTTPELKKKTKTCLSQFVKFSINQPYQVLNSEILRKHLKKNKFKNTDLFETTLKSIFSGSSKCFVATWCYGEDHQITQVLRQFKNKILLFRIGLLFVAQYYKRSPGVIDWFKQKPILGVLCVQLVFRPFLMIAALAAFIILWCNDHLRALYNKVLD
jgi:hypothetical protein